MLTNHTPQTYSADVGTAIEPFLDRWAGLLEDNSSPFHSVSWMRAWYATLGTMAGRKPLLVGVRRNDTDADVMLLPLVCRRQHGLSIVEFADAGVVDYVSPLVSTQWAVGVPDDSAAMTASASALWQTVRHALKGHDVLRIDKMLGRSLEESSRQINPLARVLRVQDCPMHGSQFHVPGSWDEWLASLGKHHRKELARSWRVFTRSGDARFERVTDLEQSLETYAEMERLQAARMCRGDTQYFLNQPEYSAFYRQVLREGLADGSVVLSALRDGSQLVAAQFGVANSSRHVALRLTMGGDAWNASSPGRLLMAQTAQDLFGHGLRWFDFGIGDYQHKRWFRVENIPLHDACAALSWRGLPMAWAWRLRRALKRRPWIVALVRRLKGLFRRSPI